MSEPDPMAVAVRELQRKGASMATCTAALIALMVRMLREQEQRTTAQAAAEQRAAAIRALVLKHLPEPMAQALIRSEQFPQLMDALKELQDRGGDVASFLSWAGPVVTREQARTAAADPVETASSTSSAAAASSTPTPQTQAPAVPDRAGLAERVRDAWAALTSRATAAPSTAAATVRSAGGSSEAATLHPDQEAWAVVTAVYACGVQPAIQLVQSPGWPALAQDMLARGYAHQRGDTDRTAARVLEDAWKAMPAARGLHWPTAAAAAFTLAGQDDHRGDDESPVGAQAAPSGPQRTASATATPASAGRSATAPSAPAGTVPNTPALGLDLRPPVPAAGLAPTFSHPKGSIPASPPAAATIVAAAATCRSSTVPAGATLKVCQPPTAPGAAQPPTAGQRRSR